MINPEKLFKTLKKNNVDFFSGVPDSLLKDFCAYISDNVDEDNHIIAANEGASIGLAVGYYLATSKIPMVYMQNSGFGNAINPILSIADDKVYGIPMLLMIGWRGEPGLKDEPQHVRQGEVNEDLLKAMHLPYLILSSDSDVDVVVEKAISTSVSNGKPFVLLVRNDTFEKYKLKKNILTSFDLNRENAVKLVIDSLRDVDIVVSTTGKTSREVFEYRDELEQSHDRDFLTVGAMGHTSSIAMGIAIAKPNKKVYCIDGDGSIIMHMGTLAINGQMKSVQNFKHIVINNGAHDSVGGQPTVAFNIDLSAIAKASGYSFSAIASTSSEISENLIKLAAHKGRGFLEIRVNKGSRENLGRPSTTPKENKLDFQEFLSK
jgi:phosphonopyruvate decarboxylase